MVGQHAEKDVRLNAALSVVKDRPLTQGRLKRPKRRFGARQQSVNPPTLTGPQNLGGGFQEGTPIQFFRTCPFSLIQTVTVTEWFRLAVVLHAVIARDARITFLQATDGDRKST